MKHAAIIITLILISTLLNGCVQEDNTCTTDEECLVPMEFAVQSNCPYMSICEKGQCITGCPIIGGVCDKNKDCDCSQRGERSLDCTCHKYKCYSIEGYGE